MCPKQVHEGSVPISYMFLSVVMIDWGNLRGQIFSRTGFAPIVRLKYTLKPVERGGRVRVCRERSPYCKVYTKQEKLYYYSFYVCENETMSCTACTRAHQNVETIVPLRGRPHLQDRQRGE